MLLIFALYLISVFLLVGNTVFTKRKNNTTSIGYLEITICAVVLHNIPTVIVTYTVVYLLLVVNLLLY